MKKEIKVSIIIPVYNTEQYLRQCLDSVINQTFKNIEIIVINDGSTDGSLNVLQAYQKKYFNIKIINQTNKGYSEVRNIGLRIASGDYIGFVDSDDFIEKTMFEKLVNKAIETNADIISCNYYMLYGKGKREILISSNNIMQIKRLEKSLFSFIGAEELLLDEAFIWNRIYKKELLINNNIEFSVETPFMEDTLFHRRALLSSKKIIYIPDVLYFYRKNRIGAQTTLKDKRNFTVFIISDKLFDLIHSKNLLSVVPWMNHLLINLLCLGYERIENKYKKEYFDMAYDYLNKYGINKKTKILFPENIYLNKNFLIYLRYLILRFLHPITINFILNKNKIMFDFIIKIRMLLQRLSSGYNKLFFKDKKSI